MLLEPSDGSNGDGGFIDFLGEIDGAAGDYLKMPAGGSRHARHPRNRTQRITTCTRMASRYSATPCARCTRSATILLERNGLTADDVALIDSAPGNRRIIAATPSGSVCRLTGSNRQHRPLRKHAVRHHPAWPRATRCRADA